MTQDQDIFVQKKIFFHNSEQCFSLWRKSTINKVLDPWYELLIQETST